MVAFAIPAAWLRSTWQVKLARPFGLLAYSEVVLVSAMRRVLRESAPPA